MTTNQSDAGGGTGSDSGSVDKTEILGACLYCGHLLMYARPAAPDQGLTGRPDFYGPVNVWDDYSLIDHPLDYGKFCPYAPPHPLGQASVHNLVKNLSQP